jgi:peptidyl-prolyl cis-trans isomerase SurA
MNSIMPFLAILLFTANFIACPVFAVTYSDKVAAVVNGDVILESDVQKFKQPIMRNLMNLPLGVVPPGKWPTEREILDELIVIHLLEQAADKKGITLDDKSVDASLEAIRKRNNLNYDQFVLFLATNGLNYSDYRNIMKRQFKLTRLIDGEVTKKTPLSEEDAQKYYKANKDQIEDQYKALLESQTPGRPPQESAKPEIPTHEEVFVGGKVRLRQITLKLPQKKDKRDIEKLMATAKKIYEEAMTGGDFGQLAKKYSSDPFAKSGGDLGFMEYKDMVPGLQKMVQRMKEGDLTPPIKTNDAVLMFYLDDAKGRQVKKTPIPEKTRKELEKRWSEAYQRRQAQAKQSPQSSERREASDAKEDQENGQVNSPDKTDSGKVSGILTPSEEKEYLKVKNKVFSILRHDKIQSRMKEWIDSLKKNSIIDVKL